jgi:hypothetical protein
MTQKNKKAWKQGVYAKGAPTFGETSPAFGVASWTFWEICDNLDRQKRGGVV